MALSDLQQGNVGVVEQGPGYRIVIGGDGTDGSPLMTVWDDGRTERAFELSSGHHANTLTDGGTLPVFVPESLAQQYTGRQLWNTNDPSASTFVQTSAYQPAQFRTGQYQWWQDVLPAAWTAGFGAAAAGAAGVAGLGGSTAATAPAASTGSTGLGTAGTTAATAGGATAAQQVLTPSDPGFTVDPQTGDTVLSGGAGTSGPGFVVDPNTGDTTFPNITPSVPIPTGGGGTGGGVPFQVPGVLPTLPNGEIDWSRIIAGGVPAAIGAIGADRQGDRLSDLAERYMEFGAPSRARFESSFAPGFTMENEPGYRDALDLTTKSFLHKASIGGNPADSPNAWQQTLSDINSQFAFPAMNEYRRLNAGTGGLAALTSAAPSMDAAAVNAGRGVWDAAGVGAANIFNPPLRRSLADLLQESGY